MEVCLVIFIGCGGSLKAEARAKKGENAPEVLTEHTQH